MDDGRPLETLLEEVKSLNSDFPPSNLIWEICNRGVGPRLCAVKAAVEIEEPVVAMNCIMELAGGEGSGVESLHEPVLALLSENENEQSAWYISELAHMFQPHVSKKELKDNLLYSMRKHPSQKENIEDSLKGLGFSKFLGVWM